MNDLISKDRLMEALGISDDCVNCQHRLNGLCLWKPNMVDVCEIISEMPSIQRWIPCDACKYNPPSAKDGKPCTMCPAEGMKAVRNEIL